MIDLGSDFNQAVLTAAGLDPNEHDIASVSVDFVPTSGDATVRATRVVAIPVAMLRELIAEHGGPVEETP